MAKDFRFNKTLVLDSSYVPRGIITSFRGFVITFKGNAEVIKNHEAKFKIVNKEVEYYKPSIIRVDHYVNTKVQKVSLSRDNVFKRDGGRCVYCGSNNRRDLTIDHLVPQSKGGKNTWDNLVTSCFKCNNSKGDMDLKEFMDIELSPKKPHYLVLMRSIGHIPDEWKPYLFPSKY